MSTRIRVLMVCLGNICRSPTAEAVFRAKVADSGLAASIKVDSAGTSNWHSGNPPDPRSIQAAAARAFDLTPLRARQVEPDDFDNFDYILAMDQQNLRDLQDQCPQPARHKLGLLLHHGTKGLAEVPDPYGLGRDRFELVLDLVEDACSGLLTSIVKNHRLQR